MTEDEDEERTWEDDYYDRQHRNEALGMLALLVGVLLVALWVVLVR